LAANRNRGETGAFAVCRVFKGLAPVLFRRAHRLRRRMCFAGPKTHHMMDSDNQKDNVA
jgi:hypothetical protein